MSHVGAEFFFVEKLKIIKRKIQPKIPFLTFFSVIFDKKTEMSKIILYIVLIKKHNMPPQKARENK